MPADFDATRLIMSRSDESRGDYWKDRAVRAEAERDTYKASSEAAVANLDSALVLLEKTKEDAERYRWLKEYGPALFVNHQWAGTECLDAAIDAARRDAA